MRKKMTHNHNHESKQTRLKKIFNKGNGFISAGILLIGVIGYQFQPDTTYQGTVSQGKYKGINYSIFEYTNKRIVAISREGIFSEELFIQATDNGKDGIYEEVEIKASGKEISIRLETLTLDLEAIVNEAKSK